MNNKLRFGPSVYILKTHRMVSKSFRYLDAFSCKIENKQIKEENNFFFLNNWTISLRNYFSRTMKFDEEIVQ